MMMMMMITGIVDRNFRARATSRRPLLLACTRSCGMSADG